MQVHSHLLEEETEAAANQVDIESDPVVFISYSWDSEEHRVEMAKCSFFID